VEEEKFAWVTDIDTMLEVYELAKKNGKKSGESIEEEFLEIMKKKNQSPIAKTYQDIDMMSGNMREAGINVVNLSELERQRENKNEEKEKGE